MWEQESRIEIVIDAPVADLVVEALAHHGIEPVAILKGVASATGDSRRVTDPLTWAQDYVLVVAFAEPSRAKRLAERVLSLIEPYGGSIHITGAETLRPDP